MNTANQNLSIATTIQDQIGRRAFAMMGAKNQAFGAALLQFDIGSNAKKVTRIVVKLDPSDSYTVTAYKGRGIKTVVAATCSDVYADRLHATIESMTGLYLSL